MAHQAKKPFAGTRAISQSSITSYFTNAPTGETDSKQKSSSIYSLPLQQSTGGLTGAPALPHSVQSNLLNVGMRVRKSVPEGYKTGSYSAFTLFSDNSTPSTMSATPGSPETPKTRPRAGNRELTPFCGILKVGGLTGQQWGIYSPGGNGEMDEDSTEEDEVPFLSSQGSTISNVSLDDVNTAGGNKRRFLEDEEQDFGFSLGGGNRRLGDRVLAVPKRKKWSSKVPAHAGHVRIFGQENSNIGSAVGQDIDFEDAEFLDYGLVGEVEMSGCN